MPTMNITVDQRETHSFEYAVGLSREESIALRCVVETKGGVLFVKNNPDNGGSNDEIEVSTVESNKVATVKFNGLETEALGYGYDSRYKLYKYNFTTKQYDLILEGEITVNPPTPAEGEFRLTPFDIARANVTFDELNVEMANKRSPHPIVLTSDKRLVMQKADLSGFENFAETVVTNDAGILGEYGFSVAPCPDSKVPSYLYEMVGTKTKGHDEYGNYKDQYGGVHCYFPRTWYKIENVADAPYYGTKVTIVNASAFPTEAAAAAQGYACHRAFIDGGQLIDGFFYSKYKPALVNYSDGVSGVASPVPNSNPISSSADTKRTAGNPTYPGSFTNCISNSQTPTDTYGGALSAMKSLHSDFYCSTIFQSSYIALVSLAQGQAATLANCAWKDVAPYAPKGNNKSGVLGDINDTAVVYTNPTDGYWNGKLEAGKNGSGVPFAKTTHNGCPNGVADVNGNQYEVLAGLTSIVTTKSITAITIAAEAVFTATAHGLTTGQKLILTGTATPAEWSTQLSDKMYTVEKIDNDTFKLKNSSAYIDTSARSAAYTSGITLAYGTFYMYKDSVVNKNVTAAQHFNSTWILANCDVVTPNFIDGALAQYFGNSTNQVLSGNTDRTNNNYKLTACGLPMANGFNTSGSSNFGNDYYYQYFVNSLCAIGSGYWATGAAAGVWCRTLNNTSGSSGRYVSARLSLSIV